MGRDSPHLAVSLIGFRDATLPTALYWLQAQRGHPRCLHQLPKKLRLPAGQVRRGRQASWALERGQGGDAGPLCSLLKVHLQLHGFSVFIDVEKLEAGKFEDKLIQSVMDARNFVLVLSPGALDKCMLDHDCKDWVHKVGVDLCLCHASTGLRPRGQSSPSIPSFLHAQQHLAPEHLPGPAGS